MTPINDNPTRAMRVVRCDETMAAVLRGVITQQLLPLAVGKGRCAATEILVGTDAVANLIREGKCYQIPSILQSGAALGMHSLNADLARLVSTGRITREAADLALRRLEVDQLGLDAIDRRMLSAIIQNYGGGPVGLETLAATIGEEAVTLEDVYEPYLMQLGFLTRTPRGRCATQLPTSIWGFLLPGRHKCLGSPAKS